MKFTTISRRFAATGVATALAAGALIGATATTADAAVTNTYTCTTPLGAFPVTLDSSIPELAVVNTFNAGFTLPANNAHVMNHFTMPAEAYQQLQGVGTSKLGFPDFAATIGDADFPAVIPDVPADQITQNEDGSYSFDANGLNGDATMPAAGAYEVLSPESFTLIATTAGFGDVPVTCLITPEGSNQSYGPVTVNKNASTTTGSAKAVRVGDPTKVKVTVSAANHTPSGTVVVKEGAKKLGTVALNDMGKATFKKKLDKGTHKLKLIYKGDGYTSGSKSDTVIAKVTR